MGLWGTVKKGAGAVGGAVKDGVDSLEDVLDEVGDGVGDFGDLVGSSISDWACSGESDFLCAIVSTAGGAVSGFTGAIGGAVSAVGQVLEGVGFAVGNALQGRWRDMLDSLGGAALGQVIVVVELGTIATRWIDEAGRHHSRNHLRGFVSDLIDARRISEAERAELRRLAGLDRRPWGVRVDARHRILSFSSSDIPLSDLHDAGSIDLYELAGFAHFPSLSAPRPTARVHRTSDPTKAHISRDDLDRYRTTGSPGITVLAADPKSVARSMRYADRVCKDVGVILNWDADENVVHEVTSLNAATNGGMPVLFPLDWIGDFDGTADPYRQYLRSENINDGSGTAECRTLSAFATLFSYEGGVPNRGVAEGLNLPPTSGCDGRDDSCCASLQTDGSSVRGSTVAHIWSRNAAALATNRFVLGHEIGHWLGLCHGGHKRLTELMYTPKDYGIITSGIWSLTLLSRGAQRPRFTTADGRNLWRFLLNHRLSRC